MALKKSGFIKTLESVIAAAIILIFIITIFPGIAPKSEIQTSRFSMLSFLESSDSAEFRKNLILENRSYLQEKLEHSFPAKNINLGFLRLNSTENELILPGSFEFSVNKNITEKETLFVWFEGTSELSINVNENEIYSTTNSSGFFKLDLASYTNEGINELEVLGSFSKINFILDLYQYTISVPDKDFIEIISYFISGNETQLNPRVFEVVS